MYNKNFSKEPTDKQKLGALGEDIACKYLENNGYRVIERNYLKKWGEIDIIAKKGNKIHFVEVKAVSRDLPDVTHVTPTGLGASRLDAVRGGRENERGGVQMYGDESILSSNKEMHQNRDSYRAEDNLHPWKLQRLGRAIQSYLLDRNVPDNVDWQFDVITIQIDTKRNTHRVFLLSDVVL